MSKKLSHAFIMVCTGLLFLINPADIYSQHYEQDSPDAEWKRWQNELDERGKDIEHRYDEWQEDLERRKRQEEDNFDTKRYEFEKEQGKKRHDLEKKRLEADRTFAQENRALQERQNSIMEELNEAEKVLSEKERQYWSDQQRNDLKRQKEEWADDWDRRREEEGDYFDEDYYDFEKDQQEQRWALDEQRMELDEKFQQDQEKLHAKNLRPNAFDRHWQELEDNHNEQMQDIDDEYSTLEQAQREYWSDRQQNDLKRQKEEWADDWDRRRKEEGDYFDEVAYEFENKQQEQRWALDEQRMELDEEFQEKMESLHERNLRPNVFDRLQQNFESSHNRKMKKIDREYEKLDRTSENFWNNHQFEPPLSDDDRIDWADEEIEEDLDERTSSRRRASTTNFPEEEIEEEIEEEVEEAIEDKGHSHEEDDAPMTLDFNMDDGDQGQRFIEVSAGDKVKVQICVKDMPESWGASFSISYDENALTYKANSFKAAKLIPNLIALSTADDGTVEVGGANFTKKLGGGDGNFGTLSFIVDGDIQGVLSTLTIDSATFRTKDDEVIWDDGSSVEISISE